MITSQTPHLGADFADCTGARSSTVHRGAGGTWVNMGEQERPLQKEQRVVQRDLPDNTLNHD